MGSRFGRKDVRTLADQLRRQGDRQLRRQHEVRECNIRRAPFGRCVAAERCEQIIALRQFLFELRNARLVAGELGAQTQDRRKGNRTGIGLNLGKPHLFGLHTDEPLRRLDLGAVSGPGNHRIGDIGRERQVGRLFGCFGDVEVGVQSLDHAPIAAEHVECVIDRSRQREQIEYRAR
jgi:hypothetical protein